jgi:hypothetical protein
MFWGSHETQIDHDNSTVQASWWIEVLLAIDFIPEVMTFTSIVFKACCEVAR